jgi:uncharacterized repeat protein (TIGR01451 family)
MESRVMLSTAQAIGRAAPAVVPTPAGTGITGEYFQGNNFQQAEMVRTDARINFNRNIATPDDVILPGAYSVRWTGQIEALHSETYTFSARTNGGVRVWVNGQLLIDNFTAHPVAISSGTIALQAGQSYDIRVDYFQNNAGPSAIQLRWSSASQPNRVIPKSVLFPDNTVTLPVGTGLNAEYFRSTKLTRSVLTRLDRSVNFDWEAGTPDAAFRTEPFSVRWTGTFHPQFSEAYKFYTIADDGVRLWINGNLVIDDWTQHAAKTDASKPIVLQAGQNYDIKLEYFENTIAPASIKLLWSSASTHLQAVPASAFSTSTSAFAIPQNVSATPTSSSTATVTWDDVPSETGFVVLESSDGGTTYSQVGTTGAGVTTFDATGLSAATTYFFEVEAQTPAGTSTPQTHAIATTFLAAPTGVTTTANSASQITVSWNPVTSATDYLIDQSTTADGSSGWYSLGTTGGGTSLAHSGLTSATTYYYRVTAENAAGNSVPSSTTAGTTLTVAPINLIATAASDTQVNLTWNDVTGETGFVIESSPDGTSNWTKVASVGASTTSLPIAGLTGSTTYHYRVRSTDSGGNSDPSNVANVTTDAPIPAFAAITALYGLTTNTNEVYLIDTDTGAASLIGSLSFGTSAAGRDPASGKFYYISTGTSTVQIATWDPKASPNSANTTVNGNVPITGGGGVARATFRDDGTFFFTASNGDLNEYNTTSNTATLLGTIEVGGAQLASTNGDIAFAPDGILYVENNSTMYKVTAAAISGASGPGSVIPATLIGGTGTGNLQIAFGQNAVLYGYDGNGQIYTINLGTGAATAVPGSAPSGVPLGDLASVPLYADLSVTQSASTFTAGTNGTYTFTVANAGPDTTIRPITVTDTLPTGLSFVSAAGNGWTFNLSGQTLMMVYGGDVAANSTLPPLTVTVAVANSAQPTVTNTALVGTTIFDANTLNNTSTLTTPVG